jgi:hypothetical protein
MLQQLPHLPAAERARSSLPVEMVKTSFLSHSMALGAWGLDSSSSLAPITLAKINSWSELGDLDLVSWNLEVGPALVLLRLARVAFRLADRGYILFMWQYFSSYCNVSHAKICCNICPV